MTDDDAARRWRALTARASAIAGLRALVRAGRLAWPGLEACWSGADDGLDRALATLERDAARLAPPPAPPTPARAAPLN